MEKKLFLFSTIFTVLFSRSAMAVCPVCTIAVGFSAGLSRWLGIDDSITGLWIGGLIVSMIFWTEDWLDKKAIIFKGRTLLTILIYYLSTIIPIHFYDIADISLNPSPFFGLSKLVAGIIVGSVFFWLGAIWYFDLKRKNNGHAYFPFQKVVWPIMPLIILSIIFYYLTK